MAEEDLGTGLVGACNLLSECEFLLRHIDGERENAELLAGALRCCDEAEAESAPDDAETAATIAVLRSVAATFSLRQSAYFSVSCDFDDDDGTLLNGMEEHDRKGVSGPLAEQAVRAARAALHAVPDDPLVPLYLGHALTWTGDRDGAVAAYEEALRRDPLDGCAQSALQHLDAAPDEVPSPDGTSREHHGFALLRFCHWINNNDWDSKSMLFRSVADARALVDGILDKCLTEDDLEDEGAELILQIHHPGREVEEYDLNARIDQEPEDGSSRIDWSGIAVHEPLESPIPPGRLLRIDGHNCFYGGAGNRR